MSAVLPDGFGLDIGSTTVKLVAARDGEIVFRDYRRHRGQCLPCAEAMARRAQEIVGDAGTRYVTGSAGAALATALGASYVHEVHAVATAVRARAPGARTVIELGGQDAKMIHFESSAEGLEGAPFASDMNERCAAGTGAVLDRCLYRLGFDESDLSRASIDGDLPVVSAKCGVFAETDIVGLVRAGVPRERALASLLDSVVRGNLAVLAHGRPLPPQVVLLGGPHAFVPALPLLWRRHLEARWREHHVPHGAADDVIVPPDAAYFGAEGALRCAASLARTASAAAGRAAASPAPRRLPLSSPEPGRRKWRAGLLREGESPGDLLRRSERPAAVTPRGSLALGIDAGSSTIKAVVLDERDVPCVRVYRRAARGPLEDAQDVLSEIAHALGADAGLVASVGVTGYAADLLGPVLGADAAPPETLAHARSALRFVPDVDVVCDIGGQDVKVLVLQGAAVERFYLSNQCAAGNGALLEATARDLGVPLEDYARAAFEARRAPEFSVGCAVFLDTERVTAQREGFTPSEILAGMAAVLPRNVWDNVVAAPSLAALGHVFVLSGGVQRNQAAVKAQIDYIHARHPEARIVLHPWPGEAGAIGAALAAREERRGTTRFVGFARARSTAFVARNDSGTRCRRCPSACPRTIVDALGPEGETTRLVTGHACERGAGVDRRAPPRSRAEAGPARNLLRVEASRLFAVPAEAHAVSGAGRGLRIAIPRVLSMYRSAPLFVSYFRAIGVAREDLVIGGATTEALWRRAAGRGTVDACFPVKVVQAHVAELLARRSTRPFDVLFFPVLTHAVTAVTGCADTASCPVVAGTPFVTRGAFGAASGRLPGGALMVTPTLNLTKPELMVHELFSAIKTIVPRLTLGEHQEALKAARAGQGAFEHALEREGARALARARADRRAAIVMLGRPYHADPGIHHDIGSELQALGRTTLSTRALPKGAATLAELGCSTCLDLSSDARSLTNSCDGEKLAAARIVAAHPYLVAIEISSFKCGQDASLYGDVGDAAREGGRPFLALHDLDETRPVGSLRLRLRTFLDAVARYERARSSADREAS